MKRLPVPDGSIECRYKGDTRYPDRKPVLDEVIGKECTVHLEQMNDNDWWLGITGKNGDVLHVHIYALRANVYAFAEWD